METKANNPSTERFDATVTFKYRDVTAYEEKGYVIIFEDITGEKLTKRYRVQTGEEYTILVSGQPNTPIKVVVAGLLAPTFQK